MRAAAAQADAEYRSVASATSIPRCGTERSSLADGLAVPMSKPLYICLESALMIVALYSSASRSAMFDLPAAVGPQMTRILSPAKAAVELVPGELHYRRTAVYIVRWKIRVAKRCEQ